MQVTEKLKQDVATAFLRHLKDDIGSEKYADLITRVNADKPWEQGICYSHDYCDANMDMLDAMTEVTGVEYKGLEEAPEWWTGVWNDSWDMAQQMMVKQYGEMLEENKVLDAKYRTTMEEISSITDMFDDIDRDKIAECFDYPEIEDESYFYFKYKDGMYDCIIGNQECYSLSHQVIIDFINR